VFTFPLGSFAWQATCKYDFEKRRIEVGPSRLSKMRGDLYMLKDGPEWKNQHLLLSRILPSN